MSDIKIYNQDNLTFQSDRLIDFVLADSMYESLDFTWVSHYWNMMAKNAVMVVISDYHSVYQLKIFMDGLENANFINDCIYKQEWGGVPKKGFPVKHDNCLIYSKGQDFVWHGERIQVEKKTAGTKFDKKGTGLKTPCSVFDDLGNFSTMDSERIIDPETGKCVEYQKPLKLIRRLMYPFLEEGMLVVDPFMGSATGGVVAKEMNCDYVGIEYVLNKFNIAKNRLEL